VKVTLYYNRDEPFYNSVSALLNEYRLVNPRISVESIDYLRDASAAQRIKSQYKLSLPTAVVSGEIYPAQHMFDVLESYLDVKPLN